MTSRPTPRRGRIGPARSLGMLAAAGAALAAGAGAAGAQGTPPTPPAAATAAAKAAGDEKATKGVLQPALYGVPTSPAFELLPDKPTDVTHVLTPRDFQSTFTSWHDGTKLRAGVALDARPFIESAGTLTQYRDRYGRRLALRTVLSAGTARAVTGSNDVVTALGIRIPLLDRADVRMDSLFTSRLIKAFDDALKGIPPSSPTPPPEELAQREKLATDALAPIRKAHLDSTWNRARIDLGLAGSFLSRSGATAADSLESRRGGVWLAGSFPFPALGTRGQVTVSGQGAWARAATDTSETTRTIVGGRAILFATRSLSASAEGATVWSRHKRDSSLNDQWAHAGVLVEWSVPALKGWLGVSYGGDSGRRDGKGDKFGLHYAFYPDPAVTR